MDDLITQKHAEEAPSTSRHGEVWYVPHFGVRHHKKPEKLRVVFDCSAQFSGQCLNDHLLSGPDQLNSLIGVLHRFRQGQVAVMGDIQRMFHSFFVRPTDRDYLRFLWFRDREMTEVVQYRMCVHLFGARSSPGVATFGLRMAANSSDNLQQFSSQSKQVLQNSFYVDDAVFSMDSETETIGVIKEVMR